MLNVLGTAFAGLAALAACVAAAGAIAAAIYAKTTIADGRSFNKTRLTVEFFDSRTVDEATSALNALIVEHGTLENARSYVLDRLLKRDLTNDEFKAFNNNVAGPIGYAAALYAEGVFNRALFLQRAAAFIAAAFYVYEPALHNMLLSGALEENVYTMARDCLAYHKSVPREYDTTPALTTFVIPDISALRGVSS